MSRALLDVNLLLALLDPAHSGHEKAQNWFSTIADDGWATCPITQNGYIRIASQPAYTNPVSLPEAIDILSDFTTQAAHRFWPSTGSLVDQSFCDAKRLPSHRHVTDSYLLALARLNNGCLATLDRRLFTGAVPDGTRHLVVIE